MATDQDNQELIRELVIARLQAMPDTVGVAFGAEFGRLTKEDLIKHVMEGDHIGDEIMDIQMDFLQSLKHSIAPAAHE